MGMKRPRLVGRRRFHPRPVSLSPSRASEIDGRPCRFLRPHAEFTHRIATSTTSMAATDGHPPIDHRE
eukprot:scaffold23376_cov124-Isochrysis_galbana.AAC.6